MRGIIDTGNYIPDVAVDHNRQQYSSTEYTTKRLGQLISILETEDAKHSKETKDRSRSSRCKTGPSHHHARYETCSNAHYAGNHVDHDKARRAVELLYRRPERNKGI